MFRKKKDKAIEPAPSRFEGGQITRKNPFAIWTDMDRLFDTFRTSFDDLFWNPTRARTQLSNLMRQPLMNVEDTGKAFRLTLETPGISKEDVNIEVSSNSIEISAETTKEEEEKDNNYLRRERSSTRFYRALELPEELKTDEVEAKLDNGVLEIVLPKKEPTEIKKKSIKVK